MGLDSPGHNTDYWRQPSALFRLGTGTVRVQTVAESLCYARYFI